MKVVEGNIRKQDWRLGSGGAFLTSSGNQRIRVSNNVASIDILTEEKARGLTGAAAGAVLGFLVAGPLGTAVGAGIGAGGKNQIHASVLLISGETFIAVMSHSEFQTLKSKQISTMITPSLPQNITDTASNKKKDKKRKSVPSKRKEEVGLYQKIPPVIKGRSKKTTELPTIKLLEAWKSKAQTTGPLAEKLLSYTINNLQQLNTFKWRYFDVLVNTNKELEECLIYALKKYSRELYDYNKDSKLLLKKQTNLNVTVDRLTKSHNTVTDKIKRAENDLKNVSFFSRSGPKREIKGFKENLLSIESQLTSAKVERTNIDDMIRDKPEILDKIDEENRVKEFAASILNPKRVETNWNSPKGAALGQKDLWEIIKFSKSLGPNNKAKPANSKVKPANSKVKSATNKDLSAASKANASEERSQDSSIEERLLSLKNLMETDLITNEEYDERRSEIIKSI